VHDVLVDGPREFRVEQEHFTGSVAELAHALRSRALAPESLDLFRLVKAYLAYLDSFGANDLELATEALPRVAQVLELKIRLLLPRPEREEQDAEAALEEALEAVVLLEELEGAIEFLRRRRLERRLVVPARAQRPDYPRALKPQSASPGDLARLAGRYRIGGYFELAIERSTIASTVRDILRALRTRLSGSLYALVGARTWEQRSVAFAAMLELVREGRLRARQDVTYGDIVVSETREPAEESSAERSAAAL
jgi:segregation and condensation protein A